MLDFCLEGRRKEEVEEEDRSREEEEAGDRSRLEVLPKVTRLILKAIVGVKAWMSKNQARINH